MLSDFRVLLPVELYRCCALLATYGSWRKRFCRDCEVGLSCGFLPASLLLSPTLVLILMMLLFSFALP